MSTQIIEKLKLSILGFKIAPDTQFIAGQPFEFNYDGDKVHITDKNGITKVGSCQKLLEAYSNG